MLFTIFCIAVWRISHMIWTEEGPSHIFARLRGIFIKETDHGTQTRLLGNLLLCILCISVWVAMPFGWYLSSNFIEFVAYTAALSGVAILINAAYERIT